jgi:hypothetical protein
VGCFGGEVAVFAETEVALAILLGIDFQTVV